MDPLDAQAIDEANDINNGAEQDSAPSGVQARIDELTGKFRSMERVLGEKDQTIQQLTNRLLDMTQQRTPEANPLEAVLNDIDPEDKRRVDAIIAAQLSPLMKRIDQLTGQLQETRASGALAQVEDPEVRKRAQALLQGWRQKGITADVATEDDAILMAEGMVAREYRTRNRAEEERAAFNRGEAPFSGVRAAPMARGPQQRRGVDLSGFDAETLAAKLRENPALEDQFGDFEI